MLDPIADQIAAEYRMAALPPPEPGEWRFISADGRPVRVFAVTARPARTQLAHLPPPADRCAWCGRKTCERNQLRPAWAPFQISPSSPPIAAPMHCATCRAMHSTYRPRVIYEYACTIPEPVLCEVR